MLCLVVLTVIPAEERPISGLQHGWEHFIAFGPAGFLFGLAYARRLPWLYAGAIAFTLALELSQNGLATRHARVDDLALLVDLITSGWRGIAERLARIEQALAAEDEPGLYPVPRHRGSTELLSETVWAGLGVGRRRRLSQGPDHRAGHKRRLPRCRTAGRGDR